MTNHWIIAPILLPMAAGILMLFAARGGLRLQRTLGLFSVLATLLVSILLLEQAATGAIATYELGNWRPPFGIVLVLDRLSALMLLLTGGLALAALVYAIRGADARGRNFHALFQFQIFGLNGAFLTGDLFNLFVFFEILLIASYGLLLHGGGARRVKAGLHYVVLNLIGSTFFLFAVGTLYGLLGTLNMADLALRVAEAPAEQAAVLRAAALVLLVVFGLKAALLPLGFWLPAAYAETTAPVAALFAVMTKVGVYAIVRVYSLIFGAEAGYLALVAESWLLPLALATLAAGALGTLAARNLRRLAAWLVVVSVGTLLAALSLAETDALSAGFYYLVHSTLAAAALFLVADLVASRRGTLNDNLMIGAVFPGRAVLGGCYFLAAASVAGLPPLSGFIGKLLILDAARGHEAAVWVWVVVLVGSLFAIVALARAGSMIFWKSESPFDAIVPEASPVIPQTVVATAALLAAAPLLAVLAGPVSDYMQATAGQVMDRHAYIDAVLGGHDR